MLKYYLLSIAFIISFINPHFTYSYLANGSDSDTDGTITITVRKTTTTTDQDGKITERVLRNFTYSSKISVYVYYASLDDYKQTPNISQPVIPIGGDLPTVVRGNNDIRTFDAQGVETTYNGQPVSRTEISYKDHQDIYSLDPCDRSGSPKLILTGTSDCSGEFHKASVAIDLFRENNPGDGFRLRVLTGGPPVQLGGDKLGGTGSGYGPHENSDGIIECKWVNGDGGSSAFPPEPKNPTPQMGDKRIGKRNYSSVNNGVKKDFNTLGMDTTEFFNYLKKHPPTQTFNLTGHYHEVNDMGNGTIETTVECTALLQLGLVKNDLEISGKDDDEYHQWIPMDKNNPDAKSFHAKAKLTTSDKVKEDTLYFSLEDVSHYKGVCSNFPLFPAGAPINSGNESDMVFSKQQDDPNVKYLDSFNVKTIKPLSEAYVTIECRDYAAYGKLKVRTIKVKDCESKYDGKKFLSIPEDNNDNKIADAWEDFVKMKKDDIKWDEDKFPEKQLSPGDGLTFFEEYRGFNSLEDISADGSKLMRNNEHVRTDPNYKDVFICDESGMFKKYFAGSNAAKINWHLTTEDQIHFKDNNANDYLNRQVNFNTPVDLKNNYQYGLYMTYLNMPDMSVAGAASYRKGKNPDASIKYCDVIWFHPETAYLAELVRRCPSNYSYDQKMQIAKNQYEATVIHEIGHAIGISHHSNGEVKFIEKDGSETKLTKAESMINDDYHQALAKQGVPSCAMTYTFLDSREFKGSRAFNRQIRYCTEGEKYVDDYFQQQNADNCFGKILIKCDKY